MDVIDQLGTGNLAAVIKLGGLRRTSRRSGSPTARSAFLTGSRLEIH